MKHPWQWILIVFALPALFGALVPSWIYYKDYEALVSLESRKLADLGSLVTRLVTPASVQELNSYSRSASAELEEYQTLHRRVSSVLRAIKSSHRVATELKLLQWDFEKRRLYQLALSNEKLALGNHFPLFEEAQKAINTKKPTARLTEEIGGSKTLYVFSPFLDSQGVVITLVETSRALTDSIATLHWEWLVNLAGVESLVLCLSFVFFLSWRRGQRRALIKMRQMVEDVFPKKAEKNTPLISAAELTEESLQSLIENQKRKWIAAKDEADKKFSLLSRECNVAQENVERNERKVSLFESAPVRLVAFDESGKCVLATKAATELMEVHPHGLDIAVVMGDQSDVFERNFDLFIQASNSEVIESFPSIWHGQKKKELFNLSYSKLEVGNQKYLVVEFQSQQKMKWFEQELASLKNEIEMVRAFSKFPGPVVSFLTSLIQWEVPPEKNVLHPAYIKAKAFGLESLASCIQPLMEVSSESAWHMFTVQRGVFWELLDKTSASVAEKNINWRVLLRDYVGFWPLYFSHLCRELGKRAELVLSGEHLVADWELAEGVLEEFLGCLDNAVLYGATSDRTLKVKASFDLFEPANDDRVWCVGRIEDDGIGVSLEELRSELKGFAIDTEKDTDHAALQHLFEQGVSSQVTTQDKWTRQNGLHRLSNRVKEHMGICEIDSSRNNGFSVTVMFPLSKQSRCFQNAEALAA